MPTFGQQLEAVLLAVTSSLWFSYYDYEQLSPVSGSLNFSRRLARQ